MEERTVRHSSIHTMTFYAKKNSDRVKTSKKLSRSSSIIMNQLADSRNKIYLEHLEEYYQELQKIMQAHNHKRIKSDSQEFVVFVINQLTLTALKYLILQNYQTENIGMLVQVFSILSLFSGIYFTSLHILNFGLLTFLKVCLCLDKLLLILICICFTNSLIIGILGLAATERVSLQLFFPLWLLHSAVTVRIQVMNYKWAKFEIIISKIVHLISFLVVLALAWQFIYHGKYQHIKANASSYQIVVLYCVAVCLYFVEFYRLISKFDGTNDLRYQYEFENNGEVVIRKKKNKLQEKLEQWRFKK